MSLRLLGSAFRIAIPANSGPPTPASPFFEVALTSALAEGEVVEFRAQARLPAFDAPPGAMASIVINADVAVGVLGLGARVYDRTGAGWGDADILVTGHYHHYSCIDHGSTGVGLGRRVHFQCPSSDGGSKWWSDGTGLQSGSGLLTFVAGGGAVTDIQIV